MRTLQKNLPGSRPPLAATGKKCTLRTPRHAEGAGAHHPPRPRERKQSLQLEFAPPSFIRGRKRQIRRCFWRKWTDLLEKQQTEGVLTDQACEEAEEILSRSQRKQKSYELILAAHAHIDMNWMWSFNETVSIVLATFRSILNIMDQYPEFCFSQSQASVYKIVEEYDPELMERIKARIAEDAGKATASAWVETDKKHAFRRVLCCVISSIRENICPRFGAGFLI